MKHRISLVISFAAALTLPQSAFPIGDSGGGCANSHFEHIAAKGAPSDLKKALDDESEKWLARRSWLSKQTGRSPKACTPLSRDPNCFSSKRAVVHSIVNQNYACKAPPDTKLLDFAAAQGNLATVEYLLEVGADPSGLNSEWSPYPDTIFFRCSQPATSGLMLSYSSQRSHGLRNQSDVIAAYELLIAAGGNINFAKRDGQTALHACNDPDIVALLLARGADPNVGSILVGPPGGGTTPLDSRVFSHFVWPSLSSRDDSLSIIQALSKVARSRQLSRYTQERLCHVCSAGRMQDDCARLALIVEVSNVAIFSVSPEQLDEPARYRYCSSLVQQ